MDVEISTDCASSQQIVNRPAPTIFETPVQITNKQLQEYWDLFPKSVQRSIKSASEGLLPPVSDTQLTERLHQYHGK